MRVAVTRDSALVIVDVQNDFLPGGALPVPEGDKVIQPLNRYIEVFVERKLPVVATRDWHPENHCSFKSRGGPWPPHCIRNTWGAEFPRELKLPPSVIIVSKAVKEDEEAYSGFQGTNLDSVLRRMGVRRLFVGGLATDYCVRATVLDALKLGYQVMLLLDATRGVDVNPGDSERAIREMILGGAIGITLEDLML